MGGVGGDILYNADQQRSIIVDIRYILFIIDKYADSKYIVDEMTFGMKERRRNKALCLCGFFLTIDSKYFNHG